MWYFNSAASTQTLLLMTIVFICAFEFGPGPICWLYISEICNDKATSVATVVVWFWTLVVSIVSPFLINEWLPEGKTWLLFAGTSALGLLFLACFMKETKGKSEEEVKTMYLRQPKQSSS